MNRGQQRQDARDQRRLEARKKQLQARSRPSMPDVKPRRASSEPPQQPRGSARPPLRVIEEKSFIARWWPYITGAVVLVVLIALFFVLDPLGLHKPLEGTEVASQGNLHVNPGDPHVAYSTDPPASGPHFPVVPQRGIYNTPFVTEQLPHFLEHGGVDVTYNKDASPAVVQKLTTIVRADLDRNSGNDIGQVTLSPRPDMPCTVAITSWQHIKTWGTADACAKQVGDTGHEFDPNNKADVAALTNFIQRNQCQYDPENQCGQGAKGKTIFPTVVPGEATVITPAEPTPLPGQ